MFEALRLERQKFVISGACELWKDEELVILFFIRVVIAQVVVVIGGLGNQIDEWCLWLSC